MVGSTQQRVGVEIKVSDNGNGISQEDRFHLFKPYFISQDEASKRIN